MRHRSFAPMSVLSASVMAVALLASVPAAAQVPQGSAPTMPASDWETPRTPWGDPDLQGVWSSDDMRGIPLSRPEEFGERRYLTQEEFDERTERNLQQQERAANAVGSFRNDVGTRTFPMTSLVVEPADGRLPAMTAHGQSRRASRDRGTFGAGPFDQFGDFTLYDRCITRGVIGSVLPVIYGNGLRIVQAPGYFAINYEMVHDTRVIPLDGRPHVSDGIRQYLGDSRARWEGDTLVVETVNLTDRTSIGLNGNGTRHSDEMRIVERLKRIHADVIDYEISVSDPATYTEPFTIHMYITQQPDYLLLPYECHEGNGAVSNALSGARAYEAAVAEALASGLPPPPPPTTNLPPNAPPPPAETSSVE